MNEKAAEQAKNDAANSKGPRNVSNEHWRTQQDYNGAFDAAKKKQG